MNRIARRSARFFCLYEAVSVLDAVRVCRGSQTCRGKRFSLGRRIGRVCVSALLFVSLFLSGQSAGAPLSGRIDGGDYTQPIVSPAELFGNISVTLTEDHVSAVSVDGLQSYVKGNVGRLVLSTRGTGSTGLENFRGHLALSGNIVITTRGDNAYGILHVSPAAVTLISGPLSISTSGQYAHAVNMSDGANSSLVMDLEGPNTFVVSGYGASGFNIFGGSAILGETSIVSTGDGGFMHWAAIWYSTGRFLSGPRERILTPCWWKERPRIAATWSVPVCGPALPIHKKSILREPSAFTVRATRWSWTLPLVPISTVASWKRTTAATSS